jgi:hypothetical protein
VIWPKIGITSIHADIFDLFCSMMAWAESRLTVNQIKTHPFFYGADWNAIRNIDPPFVPHLQSMTDTTYFPTDDLGNMPEQLERVEAVSAEKDLAFLGYAAIKNAMHGMEMLMVYPLIQIYFQARSSVRLNGSSDYGGGIQVFTYIFFARLLSTNFVCTIHIQADASKENRFTRFTSIRLNFQSKCNPFKICQCRRRVGTFAGGPSSDRCQWSSGPTSPVVRLVGSIKIGWYGTTELGQGTHPFPVITFFCPSNHHPTMSYISLESGNPAIFHPRKVLDHPDFKILGPDDKVGPDANIACFYNPKHEVHIVQKPKPKPGPGQVLVHVRATGICGYVITSR